MGGVIDAQRSEERTMALGKSGPKQGEFWVTVSELPTSPGHPFYSKLNEILRGADFDAWVEGLCEEYYAKNTGRPGIPPGVYFRMLFAGYFEGIQSQRGIAWRCSDSLSLRSFLGLGATDESPHHSSLTRVRKRLPQEVHHAVFEFVLRVAIERGLLKGKTVAVDSTTLEANAAMKSIVRKDSGEDYKEYIRRLAEAESIEEPSEEDLRRFDKRRKGKKTSNKDWESASDPESRIARMKDGRTHLAYKAENTIDLDTDMVISADVYHADRGDTDTLVESLAHAQNTLLDCDSEATIEECAADKGYHSAKLLADLEAIGLRGYIPEPEQRFDRRWTDKPEGQKEAVYRNRRRVRGRRSKALQRKRSEFVERSFAHVCETGGGRRTWLRGLVAVTKRYLIQVAARNLGAIMRAAFGVGTARSLQGAREGDVGIGKALMARLLAVVSVIERFWAALMTIFAIPSLMMAGAKIFETDFSVSPRSI